MQKKKNKLVIVGTVVFALLIVFLGNFHIVFADNCTSDTKTYCLLSPIGSSTAVGVSSIDVGDYFNFLIKVFIWIISVLAIIMVVIGGVQYMTSTVSGNKEAGKDRILNAVYGIVLVLTSYIILKTINPKLVNLSIGLPRAVLTATP